MTPIPWRPLFAAGLLVMAGCSAAYRSLNSEQNVPELAELNRAGESRVMRRIPVARHSGAAGVSLALHESGVAVDTDRLVVLVHGVFSDSSVWRFAAADLASDHRLLAIDLPGCGASDAPDPAGVNLAVYAPQSMSRSVLLAIRSYLRPRSELRHVTLVGHSLGGMLVLRMLSDPDLAQEFADVLALVDGVVLFTPIDVAVEKDQPVFRQLAELNGATIALADGTGILRERIAQSIRSGVVEARMALREEADRQIAILRDPARRRAMQAIIRQAVPFRARRPDWTRIEQLVACYSSVKPPCLIVWGARDELFPQAMGYKLAMQIPKARLRVVPETMHSLPTENPLLCASLIRAFISTPNSSDERIATVCAGPALAR